MSDRVGRVLAALAAGAVAAEVRRLDADGTAPLALTSGAHRVGTAKVASSVGVQRLRRASPGFDLAAHPLLWRAAATTTR